MSASEAVLKYLRDQNRPYSANDIFMNLHKEFGKTAIQKALDELTEKGKLKEKIYGKQKVYAIEQVEEGNSEDMNKELSDLDKEIAKVSDELQSAEQQLRAHESLLQKLLTTLTTEDAMKEKSLLEEKVSKLTEKLEQLSKNAVPISKKERDKIVNLREKNVKEWRKRKSLCMDIVNSILEGYPKDKKSLLEEIGIETDEDAGVSLSCF
ncbi:homologous-pairing protein 2 homolog [Schistocerca americana]|uniref:homologous-pairing protein 2 homolog n=1 Tax=Schistocerca americana TaxID=7009 RepID=UPI001F4FCD67|nr:homologous-pairing protein 2 homolog [Schistocerca americana]XP_049957213.1 homologous-pairing protein 2 homolog [Schistocerca serialis cubense]